VTVTVTGSAADADGLGLVTSTGTMVIRGGDDVVIGELRLDSNGEGVSIKVGEGADSGVESDEPVGCRRLNVDSGAGEELGTVVA